MRFIGRSYVGWSINRTVDETVCRLIGRSIGVSVYQSDDINCFFNKNVHCYLNISIKCYVFERYFSNLLFNLFYLLEHRSFFFINKYTGSF